MKIKAATTNPMKLKAIQNVFERYFGEVKVEGFEVKSYVPETPINNEAFLGADDRIEGLKKKLGNEHWDFLVSCESGMFEHYYGQWFSVQVVKIEQRDGKTGFGLSQGFQVPTEYARETRNSSVDKVLERLFDANDGVNTLTRGYYNKMKFVEDATLMALTRMLNGEVW